MKYENVEPFRKSATKNTVTRDNYILDNTYEKQISIDTGYKYKDKENDNKKEHTYCKTSTYSGFMNIN